MEQEFIRFFQLYKNDVYRLAFSYTKNLADTDDVTQNVFLKLYRHLHEMEDDMHVKKWLVRVTINECKNLFLSSWKRKIFPITERDENMLLEKDNDDEILLTVMELPPRDRVLIHLYYYENYKVKEIAEILKKSETAIQTQLFRARKKLKNLLKEEWQDEQ